MVLSDVKKLKINGRYLYKDSFLYFFNVGSGISFICKSDVIIKLSFLDKEGYVYVIKNRDFINKEKILIKKETELTIRANCENIEIDIIKANEALDNTLVIKEIHGIFTPTPLKNINIKVYGDSTIAGYGILGHFDEQISIHTSDGVEDFCFSALYSLNFDINIFAASGWGLVFSSYTNPKNIGIIDIFKFVSPTVNATWVDSRKYDLLIISLGTNDFSYIKENISEKSLLFDTYFTAFEKLILEERKDNKNLPVLLLYGTLNEVECYELNEYVFNKLKNKYQFIYCHKFSGDSSAIANHAYISAHKLMKIELENEVSKIVK